MKEITIALAGNPNVGKSTLFNALTGMKQHTGNWAGKTVSSARGERKYRDSVMHFTDLPGAYSLSSASPDEKITGDYIRSKTADVILIVADATCLERNLILARDILSLESNVILCLNMMDEAAKKDIYIDTAKLSAMLGAKIIPMSARSKKGLETLLECLYSFSPQNTIGNNVLHTPSEIYKECVSHGSSSPHAFDRKLDKIVTSRSFGYPVMLLLLILVFWLTMVGANYPSELLSSMFARADDIIRSFLYEISLTSGAVSFLMDGIYKTLSWVISVMLPPMAIFFPLFTLLEDFGYLPRIAFNLDGIFRKCGANGKQALTMCMGFGCNACGVTGCRIIESPRERIIAVITNSLVPCNGRFPLLIAMILIFFVTGLKAAKTPAAGVFLSLIIISGIAATFLVSKILSCTLLKGLPSSFVLELPPYRRPKFGSVILRSVLDRTLFVLARAIAVAAPAGALIWLLANLSANGASLLTHLTGFLEPAGNLLGVDGVILTAFILGIPANEIVMPIILMCYMSQGSLTEYASLSQLGEILSGCGWTAQTALCVVILCLFHFPCATTLLTIKKETGSLKWTVVSFIIPAVLGCGLCISINLLFTDIM